VPQGFWAGGGKVGWEFPVPLAAAAFAVALLGNGSWSLDAALGFSYSNELRWIWLGIVALGVLAALGARAVLSPKKATT
jgi:hypothetical protein